ncbi:MAG TPA: hypothetical protein IAD22_01800 [Candidatus Limousia pullorum]|uniref:Uncharacterized protein n=1 Tax=Candidatus Limousia pullorum TaxID=2840860 RepID=A0A9D1S7X4_9FIRM|nr:hypothetical protein [Candidatus Limousia pullorum]
MKTEQQINEYANLRGEISQRMTRNNNLITFTITTTVAILSFAIKENLTILFLLPFCIIIPMSMRIAYSRSSLSKISSYMIVFLEEDLDGMQWETRNILLFENKRKEKHKHKLIDKCTSFISKITILRYYDCLILSISCYFLYVYDYLKDKEISANIFIPILIPLPLVLWEILIAKRMNTMEKEKLHWIDTWNTIKKQELEKNIIKH